MPKEQAVGAQESLPLTTRRKPTKFTPERLQQIINLVERGMSRDEIANILGVTVASLQVTCSRLGISLRRPKTINGVCYLTKHEPRENSTVPHPTGDHDGRVPLQPTERLSQGSSQSQPAGPAVLANPKQEPATTPDCCSASLRFQYRGMEQTHELSLTTHTIGQLALEAALRDVTIGELIAAIITAIVDKDLFPLVLDIAIREVGVTRAAPERSTGGGHYEPASGR